MATRNIKIFLAMLFAALFVTAIAVQASDYSDGARAQFSYAGRIVAIDPANRILTVQAGPNDEAYFNVRTYADVTKCNQDASFSDLKVGDDVKITYFQETLGNNMLATDIETAMHC